MKTSLALLISLFLFVSFSALAKETSSKYPKAHFNPEAKPSFDCKKAKTTYERIACTEPEIAKLDVELNKAYKKARARIKKQAKASKGTGERVFCMFDYLEYGEAKRGVGESLGDYTSLYDDSLGGLAIKELLPYQACFSISKKDDDYYKSEYAEDTSGYYSSYAAGANIISDEIKYYQNSMFDIEVNDWNDGFAAPRLKRHICILNALELSPSILWVSVPGRIGDGLVPVSDKTFACIKKYPKGLNGGHETTIEKNDLYLYRE